MNMKTTFNAHNAQIKPNAKGDFDLVNKETGKYLLTEKQAAELLTHLERN